MIVIIAGKSARNSFVASLTSKTLDDAGLVQQNASASWSSKCRRVRRHRKARVPFQDGGPGLRTVFQLRIVMFLYVGSPTILLSRLCDARSSRGIGRPNRVGPSRTRELCRPPRTMRGFRNRPDCSNHLLA